ncbi:MAG: hypothetical protein A2X49_06670 [Lentisphaerae bacterium GWF2_52_8]|nr:MAG: hypothetical protein A2X49_06670 [Lentisphaerae bacterium GWF2_52_8]
MKIYFDAKKEQRVPVKSWCEQPDPGALQQAIEVSRHPAVFSHVALMPDTHQGFGLPIGGVVGLLDAVSPNMVGVDIACGMMAQRFNLPADSLDHKALSQIMDSVRTLVPMGFAHQRGEARYRKEAHELWEKHEESIRLHKISPKLLSLEAAAIQLGTLGGGNHFIELQRDEAGYLWAMIHSGSRNIGKQVCDTYNRIALDFDKKNKLPIPNRSLSYLPMDTHDAEAYLSLLSFCVDFSFANRRCMMARISEAIGKILNCDPEAAEAINIHHNYAKREQHFGRELWVHRKGATLASTDTIGIIPGSMGTKSYIVRGRGCEDSFQSCSHGAGRAFSRGEAKRRFSLDEFRRAMGKVVFECNPKNLDESPMAYKNIASVMAEQKDLVKIIHALSPLAVAKA